MQTYADYHLLRFYPVRVIFAFAMLFMMPILVPAKEHIEVTERDSLYVQWAKSKSALPLFQYTISNTESLRDFRFANELVTQFGVGVIGIDNPSLENAADWIEEMEKLQDGNTFFALSLSQPFDLSFKGWDGQLLKQQVEITTNLELVDRLGKLHAVLILNAGFSMVHFESIPANYTALEQQKVYRYLEVLEQNGVQVSFGKGTSDFVLAHSELVQWTGVKSIDQSLAK